MKCILILILGFSFLNSFAMEKPTPQYDGPIKNQHNNQYSVYAKIQSKDIGQITFRKCTDQIDIWEIIDLTVNEGFRKKGIGRELFKQCINYARDHNGHALIWKAQSADIKIDNKKIVKIYKKMVKKLNLLPALKIGATQGPYGLESTVMTLYLK